MVAAAVLADLTDLLQPWPARVCTGLVSVSGRDSHRRRAQNLLRKPSTRLLTRPLGLSQVLGRN